MASKVFFLPAKRQEALIAGLPRLLAKLIDKNFQANTPVGIKVHFGEKGNRTFIPAEYSKITVSFLKERKAKPFLFETNTLYYGERGNTIDHLNLAYEHGFSHQNIGAPVIIIDGMHGEDSIEIPLANQLIQNAKLGAMITEIPTLLGFSHFKGHMVAGFGGSIKNFSMGTASRAGKLEMHSLSKPWIDTDYCSKCGECKKQCPSDAIEIKGDNFFILSEKCTGCARCIGVCTARAVRINWDEASDSVSKKMAVYAMAALKDKEAYFLNFLIHITKDCDCIGKEMQPICENLGILASLDLVALDQACFDMVENEIRSAQPRVNPEIQLAHAQSIGLGVREYELEEV